ncbi:MAG: polysaccharide biosynthesis protein [Bacteroidia bacterium]|nr:polysaccharide biosynthesis protein [Bacteroidia bacterium]
MYFLRRHLPRWFILFIDLFLCFSSLVLAYLLRFNFSIPASERVTFVYVFPFVLSLRFISFYVSGLYRNIIRYTGSRDVQQIVIILSVVSMFFAVSNIVVYSTPWKHYLVPYSIIVIEFMSSSFILISARLIYKAMYSDDFATVREKRAVIIYGADDEGLITKRAIERDASKYSILAFLDDDRNKWNKRLEGIPVYSAAKLKDLVKENNVAHLVLSKDIGVERKKEMADICLENGTKILNVPPISHWINGELSFKQIKKIQIEELLQRDPIVLDNDKINKQLHGKTILVTGAAGSIGSQLVRQIIPFNPRTIILADQAESPLYDLQMELKEIESPRPVKIYVADICNLKRMNNIFGSNKPEIVFHAAAYKHVPLMEDNPAEAVLINVEGTKCIADLSMQYGVEKFVMISTDKAVNPTGVMGASKRIAEIYIQTLNQQKKTRFITTRFGNVLDSNGSVIPRFRQQIEKGGPVTITHPDITRFFMTIPEACRLVLEAGCMGTGGEIYVFDMGKSLKIADLAKRMIQLSGLSLGKDIQIVYTGLRPGEKLYEELLLNSENSLPTHHPRIMIAKVKENDFSIVAAQIKDLTGLLDGQNDMSLVKKMKEIVPEFISNNSVFAQLDTVAG